MPGETAAICRDFLESPQAAIVGSALTAAGITPDGIVEGVRQYARTRVWPEALARVIAGLREDDGLRAGYIPERYLLTQAALGSIAKLKEARIAPDVEALMRREYEFFARPNPNWLETFESGSRTSVAYAGMAVLKRFTAGQSHWEVSGIPRSWLLQTPLRDQPRILGTILRMGGFAPWYEHHIMPPRSNPPFLLERRALRSWYLIAQSMEIQPEIRGIMSASWLHSEDTMRISPHLRWVNDMILNNGGVLTHLGLAREDSGFLAGSTERQRLYEAGEYRPREGFFIWPRDAMLRWLAECRAGKHKI